MTDPTVETGMADTMQEKDLVEGESFSEYRNRTGNVESEEKEVTTELDSENVEEKPENDINSMENREKRARDEGFFGALVLNLCPTVRCCTFTVFIIFIDIIMFLISIWIYRIINTELLAANPRALDILRWKDARKIKKRA